MREATSRHLHAHFDMLKRMKYLGFLSPKQETPALKSVLTEKGVRLMALGASSLAQKTNVLRSIVEAARGRRTPSSASA